MNFFDYQDRARRDTRWLVALYVLAVALTVLAVYGAVVIAFHLLAERGGRADDWQWWEPRWFLFTLGVTLALVLGGTLYKIAALAGGGGAVARLLGGTPVAPGTGDPSEQRLRNVVEEMAIASGTPVPEVYVLRAENGINAFAAGHTPRDAAVAVTRGALRTLTRDELQGVIGHEFSHILNGDMRLNLRLMGVLHGLLLIALTGHTILRTVGRGGRRNKGAGPLILFGLLIMVVGYIGVFFGNLIRAAIGRSREYLADAAAAQFTRNPLGLAGALKKIAANATGSAVAAPEAAQASHFFIAAPDLGSWLNFMDTHPPLFARIQRLDPRFNGDLQAVRRDLRQSAAAEPPPVPAPPAPATSRATRVRVAGLADRVGAPSAQSVAYASSLLAALPDTCRRALDDTDGAQAVLFALAMARRPDVRQRQRMRLASAAPGNVYARLAFLEGQIAGMPAAARLPLADLATGVLRDLPPEEYRALRDNLQALADADNDLDLQEFVLLHMVERQLDRHFGLAAPPRSRHDSLDAVRAEVSAVLATLAWCGADRDDAAAAAFAAGWQALGEEPPAGARSCRLKELDRHLDRLAEATPGLKGQILSACTACVAADGYTRLAEAETLRGIADALDCPVPPFLPEETCAA
jgi:Zn-dependent protease with chaperone function